MCAERSIHVRSSGCSFFSKSSSMITQISDELICSCMLVGPGQAACVSVQNDVKTEALTNPAART